MCSLDSARQSLIAQISAAEELLRLLPGSFHPNCFIDLTDEIGNGLVLIMRLMDCPQGGLPSICINSYQLQNAAELDSDSQPFASMPVTQLGMKSLMMLGRHIPRLIETAKAAEPDVVEAAQQVAAAIATAVASPPHDSKPVSRPRGARTASIRS